MSNAQAVFPYLLITQHRDVGMASALVSQGGVYQTDDDRLYSFLSTKKHAEVNAELHKIGKSYALVLVDKFNYAHADANLAQVFDLIR